MRKIHRAAVLAAQNTTCPACGYAITPAEIQRVSTEEMKCGSVFKTMREMLFAARCGDEGNRRRSEKGRARRDERLIPSCDQIILVTTMPKIASFRLSVLPGNR